MAFRALSHGHASTYARCCRTPAVPSRSRRARLEVSGALFEPPPFQPQKLSVQYLPGARATAGFPPASRRYTLTHNDITGALQLSIGSDYNQHQVQGFYTRILRDEITAEWYFAAGAPAPAELHIYCHVSGEEKWLAPPQLRNFIFRREMTLVLDSIAYADSGFLASHPDLQRAKVYVHFQSDVQDLDLREYWGTLGDRTSWRRMPRGVLARFKLLLFGFPAVAHQRPRTSLTAQQQQRQKQQQQQQQEATAPGEPRLVPAVAAAAEAAAADAAGLVLQQQQESLPPLLQQQQQWQPQAAAAIEATRSVALSLQQEQQRLHPAVATAATCQQSEPSATANSSVSSSRSNGPGRHTSSSSSSGAAATAGRDLSAADRPSNEQQSSAVQPEQAAADASGVWVLLGRNGDGASSNSTNGGSGAASVLVPTVANQRQTTLQLQQQPHRLLGIRPLVVAAGATVNGRQDG